MVLCVCCVCVVFFFCQAEDGIRDLVRSRGLGDVYKRQDGIGGAAKGISSLSLAIRQRNLARTERQPLLPSLRSFAPKATGL